ncbi:hypothetical protein T31B1_11389 [Salinisphaera sp. T31B1]
MVLPLLLLLVLATLGYGIAFATQQAVNFAAQRGADVAVVVDPEASDFASTAQGLAERRVALALRYFPGVSADRFALEVVDCDESGLPDATRAESAFCVAGDPADSGRRIVGIALAPRFQSLWPGFPNLGRVGMPEFVRASGQAFVSGPAGDAPGS